MRATRYLSDSGAVIGGLLAFTSDSFMQLVIVEVDVPTVLVEVAADVLAAGCGDAHCVSCRWTMPRLRISWGKGWLSSSSSSFSSSFSSYSSLLMGVRSNLPNRAPTAWSST